MGYSDISSAGGTRELARSAPAIIVGPALLCLTLGAYKSYFITHQISADWVWMLFCLLRGDLLVSAYILLPFVLASLVRGRVTHLACVFAGSAMALVYAIDCFLQLALDQRFDLAEVRRFLPEWESLWLFIDYHHAAFLLLAPLSFGLRVRRTPRRLMQFLGYAATCHLLALATGPTPPLVQKYANSPLGVLQSLNHVAASRTRYSADEVARYSAAYHDRPKITFTHPRSNIVLVLLESFSADHSMKVSGLKNYLPEFDRISADGTLFINFFANHKASEGGRLAMLGGYLPLHFPGSSRHPYPEFSPMPSVVGELNALGYHTEYLSSTDLDFLNIRSYLGGAGVRFDRFRGRDEVPRFRAAPKFSFNAPADAVLFDELLARIDTLHGRPAPYFITVISASSHQPYRHPEGGRNTSEAIWAYVDRQLARLYSALQQRKFFADGVLLITADHRSMSRVTAADQQRYGDSAKARVPLLVIGAGIPAGVVDTRFYQQADLFPRLGGVAEPDLALSPRPVWVGRYTSVFGDLGEAGQIMVFDEASAGRMGHRAQVAGKQIIWAGDKPTGYRAVEHRIHTERATHQAIREAASRGCAPEAPNQDLQPSTVNGLQLRAFSGTEINGTLSAASERHLFAEIVPAIDFPNLHRSYPRLKNHYSLTLSGFIQIEEEDTYWFNLASDDGSCLLINGEVVANQNAAGVFLHNEFPVRLRPGLHSIEARYFQLGGGASLSLNWSTASQRQREPVPARLFFLSTRDVAHDTAAKR